MAFNAKLTTKLVKYSVDDAIVDLKISVDKGELNQIIKSLLKDSEIYSEIEKKTFDFFVGGRLLKTSIADHFELYSDELDAAEILNEKVVDIEYTVSTEAPEPLDKKQQDDWVYCLDVNNSHIVSGSYDNSITLHDLNDSRKSLKIDNAHQKPITAIRFIDYGSSDDNIMHFISCGHDEICKLWVFDRKKFTCTPLISFRGHKRSVDCLDIQEGLLVTGSFDKTIKIWSASKEDEDDDGIEVDEGASIKSNSKTSNGKLAGNNNKRRKVKSSQELSMSSLELKANRDPSITLSGHKDGVRGVSWLQSGTGPDSLASCSLDGLVMIWDVEYGSETRKFVCAKPLLGLDHCKQSNLLLTAACDRFVRLWDMRSPNESRASAVFSSHSAWVSSVAFCGQSISSSSSSSSSSSKEVNVNSSSSSSAAAAPATTTTTAGSHNFVSGGYDNLVKLWDLRSPKACLYDLIGHHDRVFAVNCRNPKLVASCSADSTIRLFKRK